MDILSFLRPSPEKQILRARKKVKEPHGDPSVRMNAAQRLREMGSFEALSALLDRFTINVSPSSQDEEEKAEILDWLVRMGGKAIEPLVDFLKRERQVYWPMRALRQIATPQEFTKRMNEVLRYQWEHPAASSDPRAQIIRLLEDARTPELSQTVQLFLEDEADEVRLAAVDYLLEQPEDEGREAILECYLDSDDRPRVRAHILERLAAKGWNVRGYRPRVEEALPDGYTLTREGKVKVIGQQ